MGRRGHKALSRLRANLYFMCLMERSLVQKDLRWPRFVECSRVALEPTISR